MTITVGSLFSGIGGIDLGLERAGMNVRWQAEVDSYCSAVLARHWPGVPNHGDVTMIDWSTVEPVDLICGGYPCQPFALAGRRRGDADPRHLWPCMLNAIRFLRPRWALLENVPGHLSLGFGRVLGDMAEIGYDAEWDCIPAAALGAPHRRDRVFIVGYPQGGIRTHLAEGRDGVPFLSVLGAGDRTARWSAPPRAGVDRGSARIVAAPVADTDRQGRPHVQRGTAVAERTRGRAVDGAGWWDAEPAVGRVADGIPDRVDRLHALGNAVVPQVAEHIGRLIVAAHERAAAA